MPSCAHACVPCGSLTRADSSLPPRWDTARPSSQSPSAVARHVFSTPPPAWRPRVLISGTPHDWSRAGRRLLRWLFSAHWLRGPSEFSRCGVVLPVACVSSYGRCSHPWLLRALGPGHSSVSFHPRGDAGAWPSPPVWPPRCCPPSEAPAHTFPLGRSVLPRARVPEPSTDFPCLCLLNTVTWAGGGLVTSPWRHMSILLRGWGGSGSEKWPLTCYVDGTVPAERSSVGCGLCKMTSQTHFSLSLN